ncbi:hypothetical protein V6356_04645 [Acinetobacter baumannii]|uniref:hypothetical protein n=1 Tax=Acinetobacter baumannii TaxID=470 RepID=UPI0004F5668A|nr:hypothetical protein [Acinetobacter baumannii]AUT38872.1 hypothetical protein C2U32_13195 [Acinetobacter baumannii]KQF19891.1 hypothetical protein APC04_00960 [Acinetobacter baumannii]KRJ34910.1 hypothetical protein APC83_06330 [Acinetobacter baumannii]MBI1410604.1 hypothetical protein [Acinetobacter baumannii]MBI1432487.1 hypothetical protein [Acinetobacter baumannii]
MDRTPQKKIVKKQNSTSSVDKAEENKQKTLQTKNTQIFPLMPTSSFFLQLTALLVSTTSLDTSKMLRCRKKVKAIKWMALTYPNRLKQASSHLI